MHSRFSLHLQRTYGSKHIAELIIFTSQVTMDQLQLHLVPEPKDTRKRVHQLGFKAKKVYRRSRYLHAVRLTARLQGGAVPPLSNDDLQLLRDYKTCLLREQLNDAVLQFGHGDIRNNDGTRTAIGGSSAGRTRRELDRAPDLDYGAFRHTKLRTTHRDPEDDAPQRKRRRKKKS